MNKNNWAIRVYLSHSFGSKLNVCAIIINKKKSFEYETFAFGAHLKLKCIRSDKEQQSLSILHAIHAGKSIYDDSFFYFRVNDLIYSDVCCVISSFSVIY